VHTAHERRGDQPGVQDDQHRAEDAAAPECPRHDDRARGMERRHRHQPVEVAEVNRSERPGAQGGNVSDDAGLIDRRRESQVGIWAFSREDRQRDDGDNQAEVEVEDVLPQSCAIAIPQADDEQRHQELADQRCVAG